VGPGFTDPAGPAAAATALVIMTRGCWWSWPVA